MKSAEPRLAPLPPHGWGREEAGLLRGHLARADRYLSGGADAAPVPPILGLLAAKQRIDGSWLAFCGALLEGAIDDRDRELLILRLACLTGSSYRWLEHAALGEAAGLTPDEIQAVRTGPDADRWNERQRLLLRAADELIGAHVVSDGTWLRLTANFDESQLLEPLFLIGSYVCLAMVLNSTGLEPRAKED